MCLAVYPLPRSRRSRPALTVNAQRRISLLHARRERPGRRAAEQRDELAASYVPLAAHSHCFTEPLGRGAGPLPGIPGLPKTINTLPSGANLMRSAPLPFLAIWSPPHILPSRST